MIVLPSRRKFISILPREDIRKIRILSWNMSRKGLERVVIVIEDFGGNTGLGCIEDSIKGMIIPNVSGPSSTSEQNAAGSMTSIFMQA